MTRTHLSSLSDRRVDNWAGINAILTSSPHTISLDLVLEALALFLPALENCI